MPYRWSETPQGPVVLSLSAHRSLPKEGFAAVILFTAFMLTLPLIGLLGTIQFWWMLPPLGVALWAIWTALRRSYRDGMVQEMMAREGDTLTLIHQPVRGQRKEWECNIYWARAMIYKSLGPVPNYVTLSGNGREVEIGSFLSEDERVALYKELTAYLGREKDSSR